jgi:NhaA family Na+:H+ antiporter
VLGVLGMRWAGVRRPLVYLIPGAVVWAGTLRAGVHPTMAGVVLGLLTPVLPWLGEARFLAEARGALADFDAQAHAGSDARGLVAPLARLAEARAEALAPVVRLESALHPWVAFLVMPVFAFANAGVRVADVRLDATALPVGLGIVAGLCLGKPAGIVVATWLGVRLGICSLPRGVGWRGVAIVGLVGGIGFTMSLFVASLAFPDERTLGVAKLAVLVASATAAVLGLIAGRRLLACPEHR